MSKTCSCFKVAGALIAVAAALGAPAQQSQASTPTPSPQLALGGLKLYVAQGWAPNGPPSLRREVEQSFRLFLRNRQLVSAASSCTPKPVYATWTYKNLVGLVLWKYSEQVYYCYTGKAVTYFYRSRWAELPSLLPAIDFNPWKFDGNIASNCDGEHCFIRGYKAPKRTAMTQGQFEVCGLKAIGFCNYQSPVLSITVYGDGTYDHNEQGG